MSSAPADVSPRTLPDLAECPSLPDLIQDWLDHPGGPGRPAMQAIWQHLHTCDICIYNRTITADAQSRDICN